MKCIKQNEDPWKSILDWRNTPSEKLGTTPAQQLISKLTQKILPTAKNQKPKTLKAKFLHPKPQKRVPEKILKKRIQAKQCYDHFSRPL